MPFVAYVFTDAQKVDIRRFLGYPAYGDGQVVFPYPYIMKFYLALEYRMLHMSTAEGGVAVTNYLTNLYALESAIPAASPTLDTNTSAVWKRNENELRDRDRLFNSWCKRFAGFMGVPLGPNFVGKPITKVV